MGNCAPDLDCRKTARKKFNFNINSSAKAPLMFQIRTWPLSNTQNLKDSHNCYERWINASLYDGERIEINLQSQAEKLEFGLRASIQNYHIRCEISKKDRSYTIRFPFEEQQKHLWKFIGKWTQIREGNIIRMGNSRYRLNKLIHQRKRDAIMSLKIMDESLSFICNDKDANCCRICLSRVDTVEDPLISPCKCSGSIKYVHMKCLSNWLFDLNMKQTACIRIRVNKSICQLCKTDITGTEEYAQMRDMLMVDGINVPSPYAIFEVYQTEQQQGRNYFVLCFKTKQSYTVGRSSKADICDINDKCISKLNSQIMYQKGRLLLRDCDSTHGTFIKIDQYLTLDTQNREQNVSYRNTIINAKFSPSSQII